MKLKRDLLFLIIVLAVVGLLYYLSTKTRIKAMPADEAHAQALTRDACLQCHTAETLGALEIQHKHPGKWRDQRVACTLCHKPAAGVKALLTPTRDFYQLAQSFK
jgi:hypothetical protein